jgi:hypothetical protein
MDGLGMGLTSTTYKSHSTSAESHASSLPNPINVMWWQSRFSSWLSSNGPITLGVLVC